MLSHATNPPSPRRTLKKSPINQIKRGNTDMKFCKVIVAGAMMLALAGSATAQDWAVPDTSGFDNIVGVGALMLPDYQGSDDYTFTAAPMAQFKFSGERYVQIIGNKLFINVLDHPNFELGPKLVYRFGRDDVEDMRVDKMKKIDGSVEMGGFLGYKRVFDGDIRHRMNAHIDVTQDVSNGHDGWVIDMAALYWKPVSQALDLGVRGNFTVASDDYMKTYFGVNPGNVKTSGLKSHVAHGGAKDIGLAGMGLYHFSENWHLGGTLLYQRLLGDAADSPVVSQRGSANQLYGGFSLLYSW
jgi:outer membrane protein